MHSAMKGTAALTAHQQRSKPTSGAPVVAVLVVGENAATSQSEKVLSARRQHDRTWKQGKATNMMAALSKVR